MKAYIGILVNNSLTFVEEDGYKTKIKEMTESLIKGGYIHDDPIYGQRESTHYYNRQVIYSQLSLKRSMYEAEMYLDSCWIGRENYKMAYSLDTIEGYTNTWNCTCGAWKTFGDKCPREWHFKWCDFVR
jgi:hypothetical protein